MNKLLIVVAVVLLLALVGSNAWWLNQANQVIARGYEEENRVGACISSLDQATGLVRLLSDRYTEAEVLDAAKQAALDSPVDEEWIGDLNFEFAGDGSLRVWTKCELSVY